MKIIAHTRYGVFEGVEKEYKELLLVYNELKDIFGGGIR